MNKEHYSLQTGHYERGNWQKTLKECQKQGMNEEQIGVIKLNQLNKVRKDE